MDRRNKNRGHRLAWSLCALCISTWPSLPLLHAADTPPPPLESCLDETLSQIWNNGFTTPYVHRDSFAVLLEETTDSNWLVGSFRRSTVAGGNYEPAGVGTFAVDTTWDVTEYGEYPISVQKVDVVSGLFGSADGAWSQWCVAQVIRSAFDIEGQPLIERLDVNNFFPIGLADSQEAAAYMAEDAFLGARGDWQIPHTNPPMMCVSDVLPDGDVGHGVVGSDPVAALGGRTDAQCFNAYTSRIAACHAGNRADGNACNEDLTECLAACVIVGGACRVLGQPHHARLCAMICVAACSARYAFCAAKARAKAQACRYRALAAFQECTPRWRDFFIIAASGPDDPLLGVATDLRLPEEIRGVIRDAMRRQK